MPVRIEGLRGELVSEAVVEVAGRNCEDCEGGPPRAGARCEETVPGAVCTTANVVPGWLLVLAAARGIRRRRRTSR